MSEKQIKEETIPSKDLQTAEVHIFTDDEISTSTHSTNIFRRFLDSISLQQNSKLKLSEQFLLNKDLQPVLDPEDRPWRWWNYSTFWIADAFNVNTWQIAATGVQAGLSWWETWISVWIGYCMVSVFVYLAQRVGGFYHISFPVAARSSFGVFGSIWPVLNRVVMAIIWYSVQSWIGGECIKLILQSIFGANVEHKVKDTIGSSGTSSFGFLCFFLFSLLSLPFVYCRPQTVRHLFTVKAVTCSTGGIAFLVWTIVRAGGIGPVVSKKTTLTGSDHSWAFIVSMMNCLSNFAAMIINCPDFSRLAKKPQDATISQVVSLPICFAVTSLIGILASSASSAMYGETFWSPLELLTKYVESGTPGDRAGVFFISIAFTLAQIGTNISANSLSAGTDGAALLPRYLNIRRGGFICAAIAFAVCPWNFFTTSANFTTYLSAYSVFMSSIAGVIIADYTVVRRGYINIYHLYSHDPAMNYSYNKLGVNWRAFVAYFCAILPNFVGFLGACGVNVPIGATYVYNLSYYTGFITSFLIYIGLVWISPVKGMPCKIGEKGWYETLMNDDHLEDKHDTEFADEIKRFHPNEFVQSEKGFFYG